VDLGHYFDMTVVAEGVETRQTAELLRQVKCDTLQGFYFSPPLPLAEMFRWIEDRGGPEDCA
jgi:EAL domain-containing protein (putative c-di-GMP-specific phosphodiesterase class I)